MIQVAAVALLLAPIFDFRSAIPPVPQSVIRDAPSWSVSVPIPRFEATAADAAAVYAACGGDVAKIDAHRGKILWLHHGSPDTRTVALERTATKLLQLSVPSDGFAERTTASLLDPSSGATVFSQDVAYRCEPNTYVVGDNVLFLTYRDGPTPAGRLWVLNASTCKLTDISGYPEHDDRPPFFRLPSDPFVRSLESKTISFGDQAYLWVENGQAVRLKLDPADLGSPKRVWKIQDGVVVAAYEGVDRDLGMDPPGLPKWVKALALFTAWDYSAPSQRWVFISGPASPSLALESVDDVRQLGGQIWGHTSRGYLRFDTGGQILERVPDIDAMVEARGSLVAIRWMRDRPDWYLCWQPLRGKHRLRQVRLPGVDYWPSLFQGPDAVYATGRSTFNEVGTSTLVRIDYPKDWQHTERRHKTSSTSGLRRG